MKGFRVFVNAVVSGVRGYGILDVTKYEMRLLLRCIHHFKSDLIYNMDLMRISGNDVRD